MLLYNMRKKYTQKNFEKSMNKKYTMQSFLKKQNFYVVCSDRMHFFRLYPISLNSNISKENIF